MLGSEYNYICEENNARIISCTSESKTCYSKNILSSDKKKLWVSSTSVPQTIIIDLSNLVKKPRGYFKYFGIYCWHAYSTNPKKILLEYSENEKEKNSYKKLGLFEVNMKPGNQFFLLNNNDNIKKIKYLKIVIQETYGGNRTYLNQIFLFDDSVNFNNEYYNLPISNRLKKSNKSFYESRNNIINKYNNNNDENDIEKEEIIYKPLTPMKGIEKYNINNINISDDNEEEESEEDYNNNNKKRKNYNNIRINNNNVIEEKYLRANYNNDENYNSNDYDDNNKYVNYEEENKEVKLKKIENILKNKILKKNNLTENNSNNKNNLNNYINISNNNNNNEFTSPTNNKIFEKEHIHL